MHFYATLTKLPNPKIVTSSILFTFLKIIICPIKNEHKIRRLDDTIIGHGNVTACQTVIFLTPLSRPGPHKSSLSARVPRISYSVG